MPATPCDRVSAVRAVTANTSCRIGVSLLLLATLPACDRVSGLLEPVILPLVLFALFYFSLWVCHVVVTGLLLAVRRYAGFALLASAWRVLAVLGLFFGLFLMFLGDGRYVVLFLGGALTLGNAEISAWTNRRRSARTDNHRDRKSIVVNLGVSLLPVLALLFLWFVDHVLP